jgi:hypothetical protein
MNDVLGATYVKTSGSWLGPQRNRHPHDLAEEGCLSLNESFFAALAFEDLEQKLGILGILWTVTPLLRI